MPDFGHLPLVNIHHFLSRNMKLLVLLLSLCIYIGHASSAFDGKLKLCAFNIQIFGVSKMQKTVAISTLPQLITRCVSSFFLKKKRKKGERLPRVPLAITATGATTSRTAHSNMLQSEILCV